MPAKNLYTIKTGLNAKHLFLKHSRESLEKLYQFTNYSNYFSSLKCI